MQNDPNLTPNFVGECTRAMNTRAIYDVDGTNNEQLKDLVDKELRTSITVVLTKGDSQGTLSDPQIRQMLKNQQRRWGFVSRFAKLGVQQVRK